MSNIENFIRSCEDDLSNRFIELENILDYNQERVLRAMQSSKLASSDFHWTTGYGYGDVGREKVDEIYGNIFHTEAALVRPSIVSGTHAIALAIESLISPGDEILSVTGTPYDTLQKVIGITGNESMSLLNRGYFYNEVPLVNNMIDYDHLLDSITDKTKLIIMQRSTGYSHRRAFTVNELGHAIKIIKEYCDIPIFIDNCYGEFTEKLEPTDVGADLMAGSLIKNPGGGLAYTGGYIVGSKEHIQLAANRLTAPGIGGDCGLSFGQNRSILQGLFLAPQVTIGCMKGAMLFAKAFEALGYTCVPKSTDPRSDIVQAVALEDEDKLIEFCRAIQSISPVDSHFTPYPWDMPGYEDKVIMAAGAFIEGSSIELSADGPLREPYWVYFQGGLTYSHCKIALREVLKALDEF